MSLTYLPSHSLSSPFPSDMLFNPLTHLIITCFAPDMIGYRDTSLAISHTYLVIPHLSSPPLSLMTCYLAYQFTLLLPTFPPVWLHNAKPHTLRLHVIWSIHLTRHLPNLHCLYFFKLSPLFSLSPAWQTSNAVSLTSKVATVTCLYFPNNIVKLPFTPVFSSSTCPATCDVRLKHTPNVIYR